jgi:hypothetical protein
MTDDAAKYADKIAKLLAKAQTTTPEEAESLVAKAQELMTKYAIDQALLDAMKGESERREEIIEAVVEYTGTFRMATWRLAQAIAKANTCRVLVSDDTRQRVCQLYLIGFESDVERARLLDASLQIQMVRALNAWWTSDPVNALLDRNRKFAARRQFMFSFTQGVKERLGAAVKTATAEATKTHGDSVALVLRSRTDRVDDWVDREYGKLKYTTRNYKGGGASAHGAGLEAGRRADVGQPKVGGQREIGS